MAGQLSLAERQDAHEALATAAAAVRIPPHEDRGGCEAGIEADIAPMLQVERGGRLMMTVGAGTRSRRYPNNGLTVRLRA